MAKFLISTTQILDGVKIESYLGVVNTNVVIGTNYFSDFAASFTDVFGGHSGTYQRKMDYMYDTAKKQLTDKAKSIGGNAILGFRVEFDEISGKGKSMFMLSATGTACIANIPTNKQPELVGITNIDSYLVNQEITRINIMAKISENTSNKFSEDDWNWILENPSLDIAKVIIDKQYFKLTNEEKIKLTSLISQLDFDEVVKVVYPCFVEPHKVIFFTNQMQGGGYARVEETRDVSKLYLNLISDCELFSPSDVLKLIDADLGKSISLLACHKRTYSKEDLMVMKEIVAKFENLPNVGEITTGKIGVFSKEKQLYVCRHGHKNDGSIEFCETCHENIKGLTKEDVSAIESFKLKVKALTNLFG